MPEEDIVKPPFLPATEKEARINSLFQLAIGKPSYQPTEKQVDEILSQRGKVIDLVHKDKIRESSDKKYYFTVTFVCSLTVVVLVLFFAKQYLTQVLSLIIGASGGYGFGRSQR